MALTNFKNNVTKPSDDEEYSRLLCSVPGCGKRWSVNMGSPKCSFHQWGKPEKSFILKTPPQKPYTEVDDVF